MALLATGARDRVAEAFVQVLPERSAGLAKVLLVEATREERDSVMVVVMTMVAGLGRTIDPEEQATAMLQLLPWRIRFDGSDWYDRLVLAFTECRYAGLPTEGTA
jgi:hypothetical protein